MACETRLGLLRLVLVSNRLASVGMEGYDRAELGIRSRRECCQCWTLSQPHTRSIHVIFNLPSGSGIQVEGIAKTP
jgi:hypothetical protein